ncbi:MAG: hypothetical protein VYA78_05595, partial [Chloroflexota bacterium]|nr:hypothetical protein [Chloroflexota bacterium]
LAANSKVPIANLEQFKEQCLKNDDCLDSMVAAVTACLWASDQSQFRQPKPGPGDATKRGGVPNPNENELATARLEGWLYAPIFSHTCT